MVNIGNEWDELLADEFKKDYYLQLRQFLISEYNSRIIYPPMNDIFNALRYTSYSDVKAVILGQDPYHGVGQANGLCFSVADGIEFPPSLANIFKEMLDDVGAPGQTMPASGDLSYLARQGVLLLNATLTVDAHRAGSHQGQGWETFTDAVIAQLNSTRQNLVFILWGSYAIRKGGFIDRNRHLVLTSPHPSPLSAYRGFFGNRHFSKANQYLSEHGIEPVKWI